MTKADLKNIAPSVIFGEQIPVTFFEKHATTLDDLRRNTTQEKWIALLDLIRAAASMGYMVGATSEKKSFEVTRADFSNYILEYLLYFPIKEK